MNIILKIIIAVLLIYLLNILFLSVYCRIERKIDGMVKQKTKNSNQKTVYTVPVMIRVLIPGFVIQAPVT